MIRGIRVIFLAVAIACGIVGLTLSGLVLALGSLALAPFDLAEPEDEA